MSVWANSGINSGADRQLVRAQNTFHCKLSGQEFCRYQPPFRSSTMMTDGRDETPFAEIQHGPYSSSRALCRPLEGEYCLHLVSKEFSRIMWILLGHVSGKQLIWEWIVRKECRAKYTHLLNEILPCWIIVKVNWKICVNTARWLE